MILIQHFSANNDVETFVIDEITLHQKDGNLANKINNARTRIGECWYVSISDDNLNLLKSLISETIDSSILGNACSVICLSDGIVPKIGQ